ncbi:hypothetical protein KY362_08350 [Candidatus Woesearchaeota archaeon]|nr:hypothetical protein [Candidatus Woesearchaeota archaeon]
MDSRMNFDQSRTTEIAGERIGYVFGYILFTVVLYLILLFLHKIPESWSVLHIAVMTLVVAVVGIVLKRFLK